jgi:hypothetical protein
MDRKLMIEELAREICRVMGDDPDARVLINEPPRTKRGLPIVDGPWMYAWEQFMKHAEAAIEYQRRCGSDQTHP